GGRSPGARGAAPQPGRALRPVLEPARGPPARRPGGRSQARGCGSAAVIGARSMLLRAEVALAAVTAAAVLGMGRLFEGNEWLAPLLLNTVAAHAAVAWCRRRGLGLLATAGVMAPVAALVVTWTTNLSATTLGVPTRATWSAVAD